MSDPRAYEQILANRLREEERDRLDRRLVAFEEEVARLSAELAERDTALERSRAEEASLRGAGEDRERQINILRTRLESAESRLRIAATEGAAALRELERRETTVRGLEAELAQERQRFEESLRDGRDRERARDEEAQRARRVAEEAEQRARRVAGEAEQRARRMAGEYRTRIRELEQVNSVLSGALSQTRQEVARAAGSRAWRWGHALTRTMRALTLRRSVTEGALARALERLERLQAGALPLPVAAPDQTPGSATPSRAPSDERTEEERTAARERLAADIRARLGEPPVLPSWPPVSIVVPTRNGREHLERLVTGLADRTDYPLFELVIVDNGSDDGTSEYVESLDCPFRVDLLSQDEPLSFSAANNRGIAKASYEHILLLNNDIEPFERGWLRELVAAHERPGVAAVGATLLRSPAGPDPELRDRTVQHRGVRFRAAVDGIRPYNTDDGSDLFEAGFGTEERVPAVTAAAMLIGRRTLEDAGGLSERYRFGTEDVDLGLKLTVAGSVVVATGRSILYHRESPSQVAEGRDFMFNNRLVNRRVFLERWGPTVRREYRLGRLRRERGWTDGGGPHIAITVTNLDSGAGWGDWYTAHELGDALAGLGWRVTYVERRGDAWYELPADVDYLLSLIDGYDLGRVRPGITTIAWIRNWTERWIERPWFDRADVLLASSRRTEELIAEATGRSAVSFPLATNPNRFKPPLPAAAPVADYVFTANHWGKDRELQNALSVRDGERLEVYGKGWDEVPEMASHWRGAAPYEDLAAIYSSTKLVLDDTSGPTLPYGAVNSRVFDALAAGALPITNCESGVRELFGPDFPVWRDAESLRARLDELLADERRRDLLTRRFRREVLNRHTYAHRAQRLAEVLEEREEKLSFCIKIGAPTWDDAERWGDLHFARALQGDLQRRGHPCAIQVLEEWESDAGLSHDVAVVIRGLSRHLPKPGQLNVLWNISHPADVTGEECDGYDLVCVASEQFAQVLGEQTSTPVIVLEQATDPAVFHPEPDPDHAHDLVYVANSRSVLRPIVRDLLPTHHDLAIYGANWDGLIDTRYVVAEHVPNAELRRVYSSAKVVLCDHWDDMREHGFASNRIYDALACGATVISDDVAGLQGRFEGVLTYSGAEELEALVEDVLGGRGPAGVLPPGNSFADRVDVLLARLPELRTSASNGSNLVASASLNPGV